MKPVFKTLIISFLGNCVLVILKYVVGIITNTQVLLADAIHSLSDLITDVVAIIGSKMSYKKSDIKHPKGYGRIQYVTNLIMGVVILLLSINIIKTVVLSNNKEIPIELTFVISVVIIIKYILYKYIYMNGLKYNDNILKASAKESKSDVLSSLCSLFVVITSSLYKYCGIFKYIDKVGALIFSLFVLRTGYKIIKESLSLVVGEVENDDKVISDIAGMIKMNKDIIDVDDIVLEKYGMYYSGVFKIVVSKDLSIEKGHSISKKLKSELLNSKYNIKYVLIHINPYNDN